MRQRKVESAIDELIYLARKHYGKIKVFNMDDDLFTVNQVWLKTFLESYSSNSFLKEIGLKVETRIDNMDAEKIRLLKQHNCAEVQFGVECGNEEYRARVLGKPISNKRIIDVFKECYTVGLRTMAFMMFGMPDETEANVKETLEFLSVIQPDLIRPSFFYPIPKTVLGDYCVTQNLIHDDVQVRTPFSDSSIRTSMDQDLLKRMVKLSPWYINVLLGHQQYEQEILTSPLDEATVLARDKELSSMTKGTHYRYFGKNQMYLEKAKA